VKAALPKESSTAMAIEQEEEQKEERPVRVAGLLMEPQAGGKGEEGEEEEEQKSSNGAASIVDEVLEAVGFVGGESSVVSVDVDTTGRIWASTTIPLRTKRRLQDIYKVDISSLVGHIKNMRKVRKCVNTIITHHQLTLKTNRFRKGGQYVSEYYLSVKPD
jgi:hypothetical protein